MENSSLLQLGSYLCSSYFGSNNILLCQKGIWCGKKTEQSDNHPLWTFLTVYRQTPWFSVDLMILLYLCRHTVFLCHEWILLTFRVRCFKFYVQNVFDNMTKLLGCLQPVCSFDCSCLLLRLCCSSYAEQIAAIIFVCTMLEMMAKTTKGKTQVIINKNYSILSVEQFHTQISAVSLIVSMDTNAL